MVVRYLRHLGLEVCYVRNITDIDDKIIVRAKELAVDVSELTEKYIVAMHEDEALLGVLSPDIEPRATEHIAQIITMTERLMEKGIAYQADNKDVYYSVRKFPGYGSLSGEAIDDLIAGARINANHDKHDPLDFVLWKSAKSGEPSWPSPWGDGRPGWHIECSAMATHWLGPQLDIHAGGMDLKFPHHENEIAQSEAANECQFANIWMHNGYVQIADEKMSKSLGNFLTIREIIATDSYSRRIGEVIRFMILLSHYRSPLNYSMETLRNAKAGLTRFYTLLCKLNGASVDSIDPSHHPDDIDTKAFYLALADDFNTPIAIASLFELCRKANIALNDGDQETSVRLGARLKQLGQVLGLLGCPYDKFLGIEKDGDCHDSMTAEIVRLVKRRDEARQRKDFALADQIRIELEDKGVMVEDRANATSRWRRT